MCQKLKSKLNKVSNLTSCVDFRVEYAIGLTGRDDIFFIWGVIIFVSDHNLLVEGISFGIVYEAHEANLGTSSLSKLEFWYLSRAKWLIWGWGYIALQIEHTCYH